MKIFYLSFRRLAPYIAWFLVGLWMFFIFNLSAQPADQSNELSKKVTGILVTMVKQVVSVDTDVGELVSEFNHFVRKKGHVMGYMILGFLASFAFRYCRMRGLKASAYAFGLSVLFAISDETHQLFVPGRGGQVSDVLLDSFGALLGIGLFLMVSSFVTRIVHKR